MPRYEVTVSVELEADSKESAEATVERYVHVGAEIDAVSYGQAEQLLDTPVAR